MLSFIFKSKPNYVNFGLLVYRLALGISMFYHGYLKYLSGAEGLYKVGAMLAPLGVPGGYEILGTMAAYAEMIGGVLIVLGLFTRIGSLLLIGTLAIATILNLSGSFFSCGILCYRILELLMQGNELHDELRFYQLRAFGKRF